MLKQKLNDDLKTAMKAKDSTTVSTVRMLLSAIKNKEIEKKGELTDAETVKLLQGDKKKHLDSIAQFTEGGRADLAEKEKAEVAIIEKYLPVQMSEAELQGLVAAAVTESAAGGPADFGTVMKAVMAASGGRADGAKVSALVKKTLTEKTP